MSSVYKTIKSFFNYLNNEKCLPVGQFHKQFKLPSQKYLPIVLSPHQLKYLITNKPFEESLPVNLKRTKDIFAFGCIVGLRYSDLMKIKKQDIAPTESGWEIKINTRKTSTEVSIPLPDYAVTIIKKYKKKSGMYVLPQLSGTNLNLQIKSIIERVGWTHTLPKIRHRQGIPYEVKTTKGNSYRFCDHITTHT
ncbi:MAG: hypothetical protein M3040_03130, partial [Bacteroidota bacterium]|nr:hypothetical protein [Bacteroidota bacterium]